MSNESLNTFEMYVFYPHNVRYQRVTEKEPYEGLPNVVIDPDLSDLRRRKVKMKYWKLEDGKVVEKSSKEKGLTDTWHDENKWINPPVVEKVVYETITNTIVQEVIKEKEVFVPKIEIQEVIKEVEKIVVEKVPQVEIKEIIKERVVHVPQIEYKEIIKEIPRIVTKTIYKTPMHHYAIEGVLLLSTLALLIGRFVL